MEAYLLEWLNLLLRWAHVIVGIAWIGASFYFIWLDNHLEPSGNPRLAGELWAIHGGGFYRAEKYRAGPAELPKTLHWFKWEAYWTWITGFALLVALYYANAELYLIDPAVMPLGKPAAIAIGIGSLIVGLAVYEGLCRSPVGRNDAALTAIFFILLVLAAYGLTRIFSGRGAVMHYGAILGTIMVANVAHVIIPGQRRMVRAITEGREPDPRDGFMGKQRSVHNTYFTLPVVVTMIGSHYPMVWHWGALVALTVAGALIRVGFVMRHKGRVPAWVWVAGLVFIGVAAALVAPRRETAANADFSQVKQIMDARCVACHADKPRFQGIDEAPKGVKLDTDERIRAQGAKIRETVRTRAMPPGNLTQLTDEERALIERWNP
ncbi:MAG TPA: urate hydroxylase PuuD [Burkholderiales bacterium]|nr:urate hydroxylase PuuD [Burkholderiales bacterium]